MNQDQYLDIVVQHCQVMRKLQKKNQIIQAHLKKKQGPIKKAQKVIEKRNENQTKILVHNEPKIEAKPTISETYKFLQKSHCRILKHDTIEQCLQEFQVVNLGIINDYQSINKVVGNKKKYESKQSTLQKQMKLDISEETMKNSYQKNKIEQENNIIEEDSEQQQTKQISNNITFHSQNKWIGKKYTKKNIMDRLLNNIEIIEGIKVQCF